MELEAGDILVLFSDGLTEALNSTTNRLFLEDGIIRTVESCIGGSAEAIANKILQAVVEHTGRETPKDDQSIAVIRILA
jgi:serine phosphatase RsbU (regulator of sigma subunit)